MKKLFLGLAATGLLFSANVTHADDDYHCTLPSNAMSVTQIEQDVQKLGYNNIKSVKLNDECVYKVKAYDASNQKWKLYLDPVSGKLIGKKQEAWYD